MPPLNASFLVKYFAAELWARRWLMFAVTAVLCCVGWLSVALLPDRYMASARVYVDTQSLINPLMKGLTVQPDMNEQVDIMRRTLLSRPNLEQVLRMTDLDLTADTDVAREGLLQQLQERIDITPQQERLFLITYGDSDPKLAQKVVQSILSIFVERNLGSTRQDMDQSRRFIEGQIAEYEQRLHKAETEVAQFKRIHAEELGSRDHYTQAVQNLEMQIHELSTELDAAAWKRDQLKLELARTPHTATGAGGRSSAADKVAQLQQKLNDLQLRYTDEHPDVVATKRALAAARAELAHSAGGNTSTATVSGSSNSTYAQMEAELRQLDLDNATTQRRLEASEKDLADAKQRLADVPEVEVQLAQMNRDYEVLRQNYSQLIERREAAKMALDIDNQTTGVEFRVVEPPVVPVKPSGPNRFLLFSGVLLGAIGAGIGLALVLIKLKESFATINQLKEAFGVPVLGSISLVRSTGPTRHLRLIEASVLVCSWVGILVVFAGLSYYVGLAGHQPPWIEPIARHISALRGLVL